jgi:hypothetical protein
MLNISIHTRRILSKLCVLLISVISVDVQAQLFYQKFDSNLPMHQMRLQVVIINPDSNCWQVGQPLKRHFTYAPSVPNVIVTDNWDLYPIQTQSTFIVQ